MKDLMETMSRLKDNRNGKVVTFDFDNTIVKSFKNKTTDGTEEYMFGGINLEIIKRIKKFKDTGTTVFIVSARNADLEDDSSSIRSLLDQLDIKVDGIFYTNGQPKAQKLYELGSSLHYDDDEQEHFDIQAYKKLHKDFNIIVKNPNELLKDVNSVAKGIIMTADDKFIIVQRSDSFEWDAPGGHLMEGEEPSFAFWREVKEETRLEMEQIEFLEQTKTTWMGVTKDTFYFIGRIPHTSDSLEGVIDLQWELADYFCGTYEEICSKSFGNQTRLLKDVLEIMENRRELFESYQPHSKNHHIKKKILVGLGGSKTTGATGLERVSDFSRAKSAPPGFGVLEEEDGEKPTKKFKIKIKSNLDEKKRKKTRKKKKKTSKKKGPSWGIYGGTYFDWGLYDDSPGDGDGGGGE